MDLYQFNRNDFEKRAALIYNEGNFIDYRDEDDNRIVLYDMGKFFAEIWYDKDLSEIRLVRGFKSLKCLEPYLANIRLNL